MDFEVPYEAKLALGGIVFAVVALGALSIYQTAREKRQRREKLQTLRKESAGAVDAPPGSVRFFVSRFRGNKPRYFRVYEDEGALLFLHAGPQFAMVDVETARGTDKRHWLLQAGNVLVVGLAVGAVMALAALAVIGRAVLRNAADNPEGAGDIILWVLGIIAFVAVMFVVIAPGIVWRVVQRGRELDGLALSGLREQAETHPLSFRATPENTTDIKIQHLDDETSKELSATLVFRHKPTGKWKIETVRTQDTGAAVRAFRQLFGPEAVAVDYVVEQRLKRMAGGDG